jgi:hypothetical protein
VAVVLYKDKNGRKVIALGTDGSKEGKIQIKKTLYDEVKTKRSYGEVSHSVLALIQKMFKDELHLYLIKAKDVSNILQKDIISINDYEYLRKIGNEEIIKIMFGKSGQPINN